MSHSTGSKHLWVLLVFTKTVSVSVSVVVVEVVVVVVVVVVMVLQSTLSVVVGRNKIVFEDVSSVPEQVEKVVQ